MVERLVDCASTMTASKHPLRDHVLMLIRRGMIGTLAEAAMVAGVTKQAVARWISVGEMRRARLAYLAREATKAGMVADGMAPRRPSKRQQSAMARRKTAEWLDKGHAIKRDTRDAGPEAIPTDRG